MFKKKLRLGKKGLAAFFKSRHRIIRGEILVFRALKTGTSEGRAAFIVSGPKKSAVARNLTRRRLTEIVKHKLGGRKVPRGWTLVFSLRLPQKKAYAFKVLKADVDNVFSKIIF